MERVDSKQMEYAFSNMLIFEKNNQGTAKEYPPWSMENLFTKEETDIQATEKW